MITSQASSAIAWLFETAVRENSLIQADDTCHIVAQPAEAVAIDTVGQPHRLVVLNIASYTFRIVALFDFATDAATLAHLAKIIRTSENTLQGQALDDALAEFVNMICGSVNRGLCSHLQQAGMSTPFLLESSCARYLSILEPEQIQRYAVTINAEMDFQFWICICTAHQTTLDFDMPRHQPAQATGGKLELF